MPTIVQFSPTRRHRLPYVEFLRINIQTRRSRKSVGFNRTGKLEEGDIVVPWRWFVPRMNDSLDDFEFLNVNLVFCFLQVYISGSGPGRRSSKDKGQLLKNSRDGSESWFAEPTFVLGNRLTKWWNTCLYYWNNAQPWEQTPRWLTYLRTSMKQRPSQDQILRQPETLARPLSLSSGTTASAPIASSPKVCTMELGSRF